MKWPTELLSSTFVADMGVTVLLSALVAAIAAMLAGLLYDVITAVIARVQAARRQREESRLDQQERVARDAILRLAEAIASERVAANEAGAELVRASYRASGTLPPTS